MRVLQNINSSMKKLPILWFFGFILFLGWGCSSDEIKQEEIVEVTQDIEIQDFIWQGMNLYYLWQENVPNLDDDRFSTDKEYVAFLKATPDPEEFFEKLIYNRQSVDYWSWIVDDYIELEKSFQGVSMSNGVDFGLMRFSGSDDVFGYVRYIMPDSDATGKNIKRGDFFTRVNGTQITVDNYRNLLFSENNTYTLGMADLVDNTLLPNGIEVELTKEEYTENPIHTKRIIEKDGHRIGYLLYNGFSGGFDDALNDVFLEFKSQNITELVLDLRYNPGGFGYIAVAMSSMVTGQFTGELFSQERWNSKLQAELENAHPDWLVEKFVDKLPYGSAINSLNLNKLHVIVTNGSASASELVINGLNPYIDVRLIGETTRGKYTGSITLYDSQDFRREGANPRHFYAMQPIVMQTQNKLGETVKDGLEPHIYQEEDLSDLGVLGDPDEPLLQTALGDILGIVARPEARKLLPVEEVSNSKMHTLTRDNLYMDKPELLKWKKRTDKLSE